MYDDIGCACETLKTERLVVKRQQTKDPSKAKNKLSQLTETADESEPPPRSSRSPREEVEEEHATRRLHDGQDFRKCTDQLSKCNEAKYHREITDSYC